MEMPFHEAEPSQIESSLALTCGRPGRPYQSKEEEEEGRE
jgi:hypothetical protein